MSSIKLLDGTMSPEPWFHAASGIGIFLLTFLSEDSATLAGGLFGRFGQIVLAAGLCSCFLGIWIGDLGLYALARFFGRPVVKRFWLRKASEKLNQSEVWFARHGLFALVICRFIPGTRLPTFLAAGILRMPAGHFAVITGILAAGWVGLLFVVLSQFGGGAGSVLNSPHGIPLAAVAGIALALLLDAKPVDHARAEVSRDPGNPTLDAMGVLATVALLPADRP